MGRRRHDGRRRAAKVAARRRRQERGAARPPRAPRPRRVAVERVGTPLLSDCELLEQFPQAFDDDLDDDLDDGWWDEDDGWDDGDGEDGDDDGPDLIDVLQARLRDVVMATAERRDPGIARAFVAATHESGTCPAGGSREDRVTGNRTLVDLFLGAWLVKVPRRFPTADLPGRAATWVAAQLGEEGLAVEDAARVLGPSAREALREHFLRTPEDVLVARFWVLAAALALLTGGHDTAADLLLAGDDGR
ncbi:hypothetical protein ACR9E3_22135 [Actinomycetospora sp. C-140]